MFHLLKKESQSHTFYMVICTYVMVEVFSTEGLLHVFFKHALICKLSPSRIKDSLFFILTSNM